MAEVKDISENEKYTRSASAFADLCNDIQDVLEEYDGVVWEHEKVAALTYVQSGLMITMIEVEDAG